jgi:hypothetical protein
MVFAPLVQTTLIIPIAEFVHWIRVHHLPLVTSGKLILTERENDHSTRIAGQSSSASRSFSFAYSPILLFSGGSVVRHRSEEHSKNGSFAD